MTRRAAVKAAARMRAMSVELTGVPSSPDVVVISSDESDRPRPPKRRKTTVVDIEDCARPHPQSYHSTADVAAHQDALLRWFETVRDTRSMPWRKRYDGTASAETKAQRAYEVWVSEVMLQQTQVATVIDYWKRWIARWPTVTDLARADVEEVNAAWRGLGYYRRARSLLEGAKVVVEKYGGRLPSDPDELEKGIPGVGRYTAGAIASIAYGVRTPLVDGNVHRVLARFLALHAPQTAPATTRFLWDAAEELVGALPRGLSRGVAGDWNQALMELGATVCRPNPSCSDCPVRDACKAHAEVNHTLPPPGTCTLCHPIPALEITSFPMKKTKKASRQDHEVVVVTEWRGDTSRWLFVKRPEKGLLAGLYEPPTVPGTDLATGAAHVSTLLGPLKPLSHTSAGTVPHIFSHISRTYHVQHLVITGELPPAPDRAVWLGSSGVNAANIGTGVKKSWAAVYGAWGKFSK